MSRQHTTFVLGYHGCDRKVGLKALSGKTRLTASENDYDWLGPGVYFWEFYPRRALEWAQAKAAMPNSKLKDPFVVGAMIDLRNCLDLTTQKALHLVREAYVSFKEEQESLGLPLPRNENLDGDEDRNQLLRKLDCAVIRQLHFIIESLPPGTPGFIEPFETVRGYFPEGGALFPGSGYLSRSHAQIAVRNDDCIVGVFRPRNL